MKIFVIPDVHGISTWRDPVEQAIAEGHDKIIFLGDYLDSYVEKDLTKIRDNLKDIIDFKKQYPDKVVLLLGNHEYAYVLSKSSTGGFQAGIWYDYRELLLNNWDLFDIAWGYQGTERYTLVSHAGLTEYYYKLVIKYLKNLKQFDTLDWKDLPLHEMLNLLKDKGSILWKIGYSRGGDEPTGSVLWAHSDELQFQNFKGIDQIVGHTIMPRVKRVTSFNDTLYFIDTHNEYINKIEGFSLNL